MTDKISRTGKISVAGIYVLKLNGYKIQRDSAYIDGKLDLVKIYEDKMSILLKESQICGITLRINEETGRYRNETAPTAKLFDYSYEESLRNNMISVIKEEVDLISEETRSIGLEIDKIMKESMESIGSGDLSSLGHVNDLNIKRKCLVAQTAALEKVKDKISLIFYEKKNEIE